MLLIWFLLTVVYTKANVVANRKERGPTLYNSTFDVKQNPNISHTLSSATRKDDGVKPLIKYFMSPEMFKKYLIPQTNFDKFDTKPLNSTGSSEKQKRNHWNYTTPPKLFSKSNKTISEFYFLNGCNIVQNMFHRNVTSRSISDNAKSFPKLQKSNSSMFSDGVDMIHSNFINESLKNKSFDSVKTEVGLNKSQDIDIEASNFFRNIWAGIKMYDTQRKDSQPDSLEDISKKKIIQRLTSLRPKPTSYNRKKTKMKLAKGELIYHSPCYEPRDMMPEDVDKKNSTSEIIELNRSRNAADLVVTPDALLNPNMSQIVLDRPSMEILKKRKREYKHAFTKKLPNIMAQYEKFDWYGDGDIYDLLGTTAKIQVDEDYLKELLPVFPGYIDNRYGAKKKTIVPSAQYPTYPEYEDDTTTKTHYQNKDYYYAYEEKDIDPALSEAESDKKYWYMKKSKKNDTYYRFRQQSTETSQIPNDKTTTSLKRASTTKNKNAISLAIRPLPVSHKPCTYADVHPEPSTTEKQDPRESLWHDIMFLPTDSNAAESSGKKNFKLWRTYNYTIESTSESSSPVYFVTESIEDDNELLSRSTGLFDTGKGESARGETTTELATSLSIFYEEHTDTLTDLTDKSEYSIYQTTDTDETEDNEYKGYDCTCTPEVEEAVLRVETTISTLYHDNIYSFLHPKSSEDSYSAGFYDDELTEVYPSKRNEAFSIPSYDPYDDYNIVSDIESRDGFHEQSLGNVTIGNKCIFRKTRSPKKKVKARRNCCSGFRILSSYILLICISWLGYYISLA
ncbi:unnamed protein product [Nezara viridula]|uniref:Neuropeptide n=1 Tax=Nezara viridula TaxID=85310 RepID=A0A9P0MUP4_NEZVI|nr:unnamed protein product [Nezara viridula]